MPILTERDHIHNALNALERVLEMTPRPSVGDHIVCVPIEVYDELVETWGRVRHYHHSEKARREAKKLHSAAGRTTS